MLSEITILVVDDEIDIVEIVKYNLAKEGYNVVTARNGKEAIAQAQIHLPQLILLDMMMPEMNGMDTCQTLRSMPQFRDTLIVFLSARSEEYTQVWALDIGADDYIAKPIKPRLLVSKVKALLRRYLTNDNEEENILKVGNLVIDRQQFLVRQDDVLIELPRKEFNLLYLLATQQGKVFTREEILSRIWGDDVIVNDRTIDVHVRKLREKFGDNFIKTIKGVGYKLDG
ncbi:MAG: response regulator transcription factor [Chitinophagales bacterium]|jgi:two-component system alkaline phosphatase synthesis response regulator PhoP|nr:response regulator transcription factor [Chitinophagales bacterium]HNI43920.1 response regulator transcription factor [Chitinophagales bacterium]